MVSDIRGAYVFAPAARELYAELLKEDKDTAKDLAGKLNWSLHDTRDAAKN